MMSARERPWETAGTCDCLRMLERSAREIVVLTCPVHWLRVGWSLLEHGGRAASGRGGDAVRERLDAAEQLRLFATIVQQSSDAIIVQSPDGTITQWNNGARRIYGYTAEEAIGRPASFLDPPDLGGESDELLRVAIQDSSIRTLDTRRVCWDGTVVQVSLTVAPILGPDDGLLGVSSVARDITEQIRAQERLLRSERQLDDAQALAHVGSWDLDLSQPRAVFSAELCRILGQAPGFAPTLEEYTACVHPDDREAAVAGLRAACEGHAGESEYRIIRPNGEVRYLHARRTPRIDGDGRVTHLFGAVQDVTERKRDEARLEMLATHDPLTGLPNRRTFDDRIISELSRARRHERELSLALLDVDRFKRINDTLGHLVGDTVLAGIAQVLRNQIRGDELIARVGGEEFAWILPDADAGGAQAAVKRCLAAVESTRFEGVPGITVSAGICSAQEGMDVVELYRRADDALLAAKHAGRNRIIVANGNADSWQDTPQG
jgi:diguanylate cyclase (GGDEF)-like protein/PAS domain S-box-containing protein